MTVGQSAVLGSAGPHVSAGVSALSAGVSSRGGLANTTTVDTINGPTSTAHISGSSVAGKKTRSIFISHMK